MAEKEFTPLSTIKHGKAVFPGPEKNDDGSVKKPAKTYRGPAELVDYFVASGWATGPKGETIADLQDAADTVVEVHSVKHPAKAK